MELALLQLQLEADFQYTISDDDMIAHIVYNVLPKEYDNTLEILRKDLDRTQPPDLEDVKETIREKYEIILSRKQGKKKDENEEQVLATKVGGKFFKGTCRICGKKGHKAGDCWENSKNADKRPDWYKPGENRKQESTSDETRTCNYCKKVGHLVKDCYKLKNKQKKEESADVLLINCKEISQLDTTDQILTTMEKEKPKCESCVFIADSAASSHMTFLLDGMYDLEDHRVPVTVGNKSKIYSEKRGKYKGKIVQKDGTTMELSLKDVLYVPGLLVNLFSITKAIEHPKVSLGSDGDLIKLLVGKKSILFDQVIETGKGRLLGVKFLPASEFVQVTQEESRMEIDKFHSMLGHPNEQIV
jgi:hypothetical protein